MPAPSYAPLDEALEILAPYGIELRNGSSNHAPMVAEALCAMGRPEPVLPWIGRYRERMLPRSEAGERIRREEWRGGVGDKSSRPERRDGAASGDHPSADRTARSPE